MTTTVAATHDHFTAARDPAVEELLKTVCVDLGADLEALPLRHRLAAVYLGGGYGRGEGGVTRISGCPAPYNDLDLFAFIHPCSRSDQAEVAAELDTLSAKWSKKLGIEVDFSPLKTEAQLAAVWREQMYQELKFGHVLLCGTDLLASRPQYPAESLMLEDAVRQLLNRGAGLLMSLHKFTAANGIPDENERRWIIRNLWKTVLGCGDALLVASGSYSYTSDERRERIAIAAGLLPPRLPGLYAAALNFKVRPEFSDEPPLDLRLEETADLWRLTVLSFASVLAGQGQIIQWAAARRYFRHSGKMVFECPLRSALRWLVKIRDPRPLNELLMTPRVRCFMALCDMLFEKDRDGEYISKKGLFYDGYEYFIRRWHMFN